MQIQSSYTLTIIYHLLFVSFLLISNYSIQRTLQLMQWFITSPEPNQQAKKRDKSKEAVGNNKVHQMKN